jgi:hypothetical protein
MCRRLGGQKRGGAVLVAHGGGNKSLALRQKFALYQRLVRQPPDKGCLTAITVRRVVFSAQSDVAPSKQGGERLRVPGAGLLRESRLDSGKTHVASIFQAEAACIDNSGYTAVALSFERARCRRGRPGRTRCEHSRNPCDPRRPLKSVRHG